jgi:hypothetical protein
MVNLIISYLPAIQVFCGMDLRLSRKQFLLGLPLASLALASCKKSSDSAQNTAGARKKIKLGYMGITCEAPIFVAREQGFFEEEKVEVEMVKCEWSQFKDLLGLGEIHLGHQPIMMFLKPIEEGLERSKQSKICGANESACRAWERPLSFLPIECWGRTRSIPGTKSNGVFSLRASSGWPWKKARWTPSPPPNQLGPF